MTNYKVYADAADNIQNGWLQGGFTDKHGRVCMVQGALNARQLGGDKLSRELEAELDTELSQYWFYRALRRAAERQLSRRVWKGYSPIQVAIMTWNDIPGRRKQTVVNAFKSLSLKLALDEISQLRIRIVALQDQNEQLEATIERLERENRHLWRRLFNYAKLRDAKQERSTTEEELSGLDRELAELTAHYAPA